MPPFSIRNDPSQQPSAVGRRERPPLIIAIVVCVALLLATGPLLRWLLRQGVRHDTVVLILAAEVGAMAGYFWHVTRRPAQSTPHASRPSGHVDSAKRAALIEQVQALSAAANVVPVVTAAQFFDGNGDDGSIAANLIAHPGVAHFAELVSAIEQRPDVQAVLVGITDLMADDLGSWPYSDTLYVITSASPDSVREWFADVDPDEVDTGFTSGNHAPPGAPPLAPGMAPVRVWWD